MKKFVIITDSSSDLTKELREQYDLDQVYMRIAYEDNDIPASPDWEILPVKEFYDLMRNGIRIRTAQVNAEDYRITYDKYLSQGYDILSISTSSGLSASYSCSLLVQKEMQNKYPDAKLICIDSRTACIGLGILCIAASKERAQGKTIEQVAEFVENNKMRMNQIGTVEDLTYLKRAGRVSALSALFGGLLQVKPIIVSDRQGHNVSVAKVKGRQNSIIKVADMFAEAYATHPYQIIGIVHADCADEAQTLVNLIRERLPNDQQGVEFLHSYLGPIVGASCGPGMLAVYFFGKEVTLSSEQA